MSYPMTFQRVLARNGLKDGGYDDLPANFSGLRVNVDDRSDSDPLVGALRREVILGVVARVRMLAGDLRRLEIDAADEKATCERIAGRLRLDADVVAAVLKEFMAW